MHQPIQAITRTDQGQVRERQEDRCAALTWPNRQVALLAVADGMGGYAGGELASTAAMEAVVQALQPYLIALQPTATIRLPEGEVEAVSTTPSATRKLDLRTVKLAETQENEQDQAMAALLQQVVHQAHLAIREKKAQAEGAFAEAGSTLTLALVIGRRLHLAHVGDSRAYLWRQSVLRQLTHDHSGAALLVTAGLLTPSEARQHAATNQLYRFLGGAKQEATPELLHTPLAAGDLLLLCSDGLWGMIPDTELAALLTAENDLATLATQLIDTANANSGQDNISVVLAQIA